MKPKNHNLFTIGNTKTQKGEKLGYLTLILHLSPHKQNERGVNLCPFASPECIAACLNHSGLADVFKTIIPARERKTNEFLDDRRGFLLKLMQEILYYRKKAKEQGLKLAIRLNGTSDIPWYKMKIGGKNIMEWFPPIQFYDYTKSLATLGYYIAGDLPKNYHVTFSWSGSNEQHCQFALSQGVNVAVPFHKKLPDEFMGVAVLDGDEHDLRFKDIGQGCIVGLRVKGNRQKKQSNVFLVTIEKKP